MVLHIATPNKPPRRVRDFPMETHYGFLHLPPGEHLKRETISEFPIQSGSFGWGPDLRGPKLQQLQHVVVCQNRGSPKSTIKTILSNKPTILCVPYGLRNSHVIDGAIPPLGRNHTSVQSQQLGLTAGDQYGKALSSHNQCLVVGIQWLKPFIGVFSNGHYGLSTPMVNSCQP